MVKSSIAGKCRNCPLYNQGQVIGETNCEDDITKVDLLILGEAPASEELKQNRPLVGVAGKIFREVFETLKLNEEKYFISNVVLCANIEKGRTNNPPPDAVQYCKPNWQTLIDTINPKITIIMGTIPMTSFDIATDGIVKRRGKIYRYKNHKVLLTCHPSFVKRNGGLSTEHGNNFINDFRMAKDILSPKKEIDIPLPDGSDDGGIFTIKLPSWCYSKDICLVDIQTMNHTKEVLYIFKNIKGEKIFHKVPDNIRYFYGVTGDIKNSPMLLSVDDVDLFVNENKNNLHKKALYESDVRTEIKHSIDYHFNREFEEPNIPPSIMFFDIEVYLDGSREFPDPKEGSKKPINSISFKMKGRKTYVLINKLSKMDKTKVDLNEFKDKDIIVKFYKNEKSLLQDFCKAIKFHKPDLLAGWNSTDFDIPTIYNRMRKKGLDPGLLSPIGHTFINPLKYGEIYIYGTYALDMMELFKEVSQKGVEESYKLDAIAQKYLNYGKVQYDITLDHMFENDINKFIEYSSRDTEILDALDDELGHISLKAELVRICASTWKVTEITSGQIDPLCISYAKKKDMVCRDSLCEKPENVSMPGAFVKKPDPGLHSYVIDLDFSSLYPSIVRSCNIGPNTFVARMIDDEKQRLYFSTKDRNHVLNKKKEWQKVPYMNGDAFKWIYNRSEYINSGKKIILELNPIYETKKKISLTPNEFEKYLKDNDAIITVSGTIFKGHKKELSFFNEILSYLMNSRKKYKDMMKNAKKNNDDSLTQKYDCVQMAYKILANSLYGVLANYAFRFYNIDMAKTITLTGQELVKFSGYHLGKYMINNNDKEIESDFIFDYNDKNINLLIYQDTDSLFVDMGEYLIKQGKLEMI